MLSFLAFPYDIFGGRRGKSAADFSKQHRAYTYFLGLDLFQFFRDAFSINIDLVSDVNLEIEGRKQGFNLEIRGKKQGFRSQQEN